MVDRQDLNRLREARGSLPLDPSEFVAEEIMMLRAAEAVLDAPTVWWCAVHRCGLWEGDSNTETCALHDWEKEYSGDSSRCRFESVVVVPVKGES